MGRQVTFVCDMCDVEVTQTEDECGSIYPNCIPSGWKSVDNTSYRWLLCPECWVKYLRIAKTCMMEFHKRVGANCNDRVVEKRRTDTLLIGCVKELFHTHNALTRADKKEKEVKDE